MAPCRLVTALIVALLPFYLGCSSSNDVGPKEPEIKEVAQDNFDPTAAGQEELFENGRRYYQRALYSLSRETFDNLARRFPLGPFAEFAEIKAADAVFEGGEFAVAAPLYEEFCKNRPASPTLPYALMQTARSYHFAQRGVGRDTTNLNKALEYYNRLQREFPNSIYSLEVEAQADRLRDELAAYDKMVLDYYAARQNSAAYEARLKEFEEKWAKPPADFSLPQEPPAIAETRQLVELPDLPQPSAAAGSILQTASAASGSKQGETTGKKSGGLAPDVVAPGALVRHVDCNAQSGLVFLYLNKTVGPDSLLGIDPSFQEGVMHVKIPALTSSGPNAPEHEAAEVFSWSFNCFAKGDLKLNANGRIQLPTSHSKARIMTLDKPARILIALVD